MKKQLGTRHSPYFFERLEILRKHYESQGKIYSKAEIIELAIEALSDYEVLEHFSKGQLKK